MLARLGLVLYWLCCSLAVITGLLGAYIIAVGNPLGKLTGVAALIAASLVWLLGRALRFILSDE